MASALRYVLYFNIFIVVVVLTQIFDLLTQVNDSSLDKWLVKSMDIKSPQTPGLIPKIIHQTYKTEQVPEKWIANQKTVKENNPDFEYMFWTDDSAREFLSKEYPWFVETFDGYKHKIMRSDALRYFVLHHYGGFYIDLDIGLKQSLNPLRTQPTAFYKTHPVGVSNDFMGCSKHHPFMEGVINNLQKYDRQWIVPYLTVMYGTGPLFLSIILQKYNLFRRAKKLVQKADTSIYLMRPSDLKFQPLSDFMYHTVGSSWHENDANMFLFVANHPLFTAFAITSVVFVALYYEVKLVNFLMKWMRTDRKYEKYERMSF